MAPQASLCSELTRPESQGWCCSESGFAVVSILSGFDAVFVGLSHLHPILDRYLEPTCVVSISTSMFHRHFTLVQNSHLAPQLVWLHG